MGNARSARSAGDLHRYRAAFAAAERAIAEGSPDPTATEVAVLHERVLAGHPFAVEALIERLLPVLTRSLRRRFPRADEHAVAEAVEDALLGYSKRPVQFDRSRGVPLLSFLGLAAARNLSNLLRGESRRSARERAFAEEVVLQSHSGRPDERQAHAELTTLKQRLMAAATQEERPAVQLIVEGEQRVDVLARALGLDRLSPEAQRRGLKRLKDRLRNRMRRLMNKAKG
jgi:RNA polymerase sigma-70 factor (ECF subfamily)